MICSFPLQVDDTAELRVACDNLLEEFEGELEAWFSGDRDHELDYSLCKIDYERRLNFTCCMEEYPDTDVGCQVCLGAAVIVYALLMFSM